MRNAMGRYSFEISGHEKGPAKSDWSCIDLITSNYPNLQRLHIYPFTGLWSPTKRAFLPILTGFPFIAP